MEILLDVENLTKHFPLTQGVVLPKQVGIVRAVDGVSFQVRRRETLGLVGESGCGKSTTARLILRLIEPISGEVRFEGRDVLKLSKREMRELRRDMQIIFQDPYGSLNPRMTAGDIISEPLEIYGLARGRAKQQRANELLETVGLSARDARRYPHEFSGGQRQRIGVARALALSPKLVVCDEPVSALDVSIRAQIINLLRDLQQEFGLTYLFISHDLGVVNHMCDRVAVMYMGRIVEFGSKDELYAYPAHPYTEALLASIPVPDPEFRKRRVILDGEVPSPINPPCGCRFHPRCHLANDDVCKEKEPALVDIGSRHYVACHFGFRTVGVSAEARIL